MVSRLKMPNVLLLALEPPVLVVGATSVLEPLDFFFLLEALFVLGLPTLVAGSRTCQAALSNLKVRDVGVTFYFIRFMLK